MYLYTCIMKNLKHLFWVLVCIAACVSCEMSSAKKAVKKEVEEFGLEVNKIELEKVEPGVYEGKVYLQKSILGLVNVIRVDAEKVDDEWIVTLDY